jgi:two-component system, NarL family, nitrate/nitrite response regulator NarL
MRPSGLGGWARSLPTGSAVIDYSAGSERKARGRRVAVCSAIRLYCEGIALALEHLDAVEVVAVARDAAECRSLVWDLNLEMVLLDMATEGSVDNLRELSEQTAVVALAVPDAEHEVIAYAEAGASAYVMREAGLDALVATVESVARGELSCSARTAGMLLRRVRALAADRASSEPAADVHLTRRELDILELLEEGLSNKQIAARLCIELPTVKNHVHHILEKLEVSRRAEAVAWARRRALLAGPLGSAAGI